MNKFIGILEKSYEKTKEARRFQKFILINKINTKMNVEILPFNKKETSEKFDGIELSTKWYYEVTGEEP